MASCDTCNADTSWDVGTAYTADEFRELVRRGYVPDGPAIQMMTMMMSISREEAIAQWKSGLVAQSMTPWLLCPACAGKAAKFMPKTAGTGPPAGQPLTERVTPEMLRRPAAPLPEIPSATGGAPKVVLALLVLLAVVAVAFWYFS